MKKKIAKIALLTSAAAALLHVINKTVNFFSTHRHHLHQPHARTYHWKLGDVYYTKKGQGTPVLLIHDLTPDASAYEWNGIEDSLAMNHTVYSIDLPGCGRSEKQKLSYTSYYYIQLLSDFTKEVIRQKTDVIASGSSVSVVLMLCKMEESLFHTIGLISPEDLDEHYQSVSFSKKCYRQLINLPLIGTFIYQWMMGSKKLNLYFAKNMTSDFNEIQKYVTPYYRESANLGKAMGKYLYSSALCGCLHVNILEALRDVNHNIFILYGGADEEMQKRVEKYVFFNPSIETAPIPDCRRYPHLEDPDTLMEQLHIFL